MTYADYSVPRRPSTSHGGYARYGDPEIAGGYSQQRPRTATAASKEKRDQQERKRFQRKFGTQPRGPERFYYDKNTWTGAHAKGGPTIVDVGRTMHTTESLMVRGGKPLEKDQAWHLAAPVLTIGNQEDSRKHRFLSEHEDRGVRVHHREDFSTLEQSTRPRLSSGASFLEGGEGFDASPAEGSRRFRGEATKQRRSDASMSHRVSDGSLLQPRIGQGGYPIPPRRSNASLGYAGGPGARASSDRLMVHLPRHSVAERKEAMVERQFEESLVERRLREGEMAGKFTQKWGSKPRFPERLYYDKNTYTGVYREQGGPQHYDLGKNVFDAHTLMDRRKPAVRTNGIRMDARTLPPSADEFRDLYNHGHGGAHPDDL